MNRAVLKEHLQVDLHHTSTYSIRCFKTRFMISFFELFLPMITDICQCCRIIHFERLFTMQTEKICMQRLDAINACLTPIFIRFINSERSYHIFMIIIAAVVFVCLVLSFSLKTLTIAFLVILIGSTIISSYSISELSFRLFPFRPQS